MLFMEELYWYKAESMLMRSNPITVQEDYGAPSLHAWICPSLRGEGREGHSAILVGKRLFIFGGCGKSTSNNSDEVYHNVFYILNTEIFVWKEGTTSPCDSHTCCSSWKNKVILAAHDYTTISFGNSFDLSDLAVWESNITRRPRSQQRRPRSTPMPPLRLPPPLPPPPSPPRSPPPPLHRHACNCYESVCESRNCECRQRNQACGDGCHCHRNKLACKNPNRR